MKHGKKSSHSPRFINAVKQIAAFARQYYSGSGWYWWHGSKMSPKEFYDRLYYLAFKADKYDILNKLAKGFSKPLVSFVRGDIRHVAIKAATTATNTIILVFFILILTI